MCIVMVDSEMRFGIGILDTQPGDIGDHGVKCCIINALAFFFFQFFHSSTLQYISTLQFLDSSI